MIPILKECEDGSAMFGWASQKIMLCCLFGKYEEAEEVVKLVENYEINTPGQVFEFNYHYYSALCKLRKIKISDNMKEQEVLDIVKGNLKKLKTGYINLKLIIFINT